MGKEVVVTNGDDKAFFAVVQYDILYVGGSAGVGAVPDRVRK